MRLYRWLLRLSPRSLQRDYGAAMDAGRAAVAANPDDVWAIHAVVHTYEMQGMVDTGIDFLRSDRTVWESGNRARNTLPTVAEHLAMRRHSAATEMFFDLIEPVHGIELPAGVLADEHFRSLRRHAGTVIGLYNDLISWRKEMAVGDLHNIVFIVGRELGLAPADSIGAAVAEHDKQMAAFLAARDALALGPWGADPTVRTAAADVAHWVRGNLDWSFESGRYPAGLDVPSPRRPAD